MTVRSDSRSTAAGVENMLFSIAFFTHYGPPGHRVKNRQHEATGGAVHWPAPSATGLCSPNDPIGAGGAAALRFPLFGKAPSLSMGRRILPAAPAPHDGGRSHRSREPRPLEPGGRSGFPRRLPATSAPTGGGSPATWRFTSAPRTGTGTGTETIPATSGWSPT